MFIFVQNLINIIYMKLKIVFLSVILLFVFVFINHNNAVSYTDGSPAGYAGSPGDGKNCVTCHGGGASNITDWITSDIPETGYIAGNTYTITVTVTGLGNKGFQVSSQNISGVLKGTLIAGTDSKLVGSGKYITQNSASSSNPKTWTFQWTAPVTGTGDVTFYGAFTVSKPVTKLSTLLVHENTNVGINEISINEFNIFPNPVKDIFEVNYHLICNSDVEINLYSIDGKKISSLFKGKQDSGNQSQQFNVKEKITTGIYFVEFIISDKYTVEKIVVE